MLPYRVSVNGCLTYSILFGRKSVADVLDSFVDVLGNLDDVLDNIADVLGNRLPAGEISISC